MGRWFALSFALSGWLMLAPRAGADVRDLSAHVDGDRWRLVAVEYARSDGVRQARLVRGGGGGRVDMSWYFFVAVGQGRVVLIDCGTDALARRGRATLRERWRIAEAVPVSDALGRVGLEPSDVTDVVLTHHHWDHVGALGLFEEARVHVHRREWRRLPARLRGPVERDERLHAVGDGATELFPGLAVDTAGAHTPDQLMVHLDCGERRVVVAGDAAYLYRNIEEERPVAVAVDRRRNVADVAEAVREVGADDVLPGHDPAVFERFPSEVEGVASICE